MAESERGPSYGQVGQAIARLEATVESLAANVQALYSTVDRLAKHQQPQWGVLASWAAVVIATIAAIGGLGVSIPLNKLESVVEGEQRISLKQAYDNGARDAHIERIGEWIVSQDTVLQREMRDLDRILQQEMSLMKEANMARYEALLNDVERVEERLRATEATRFTDASGRDLTNKVWGHQRDGHSHK